LVAAQATCKGDSLSLLVAVRTPLDGD